MLTFIVGTFRILFKLIHTLSRKLEDLYRMTLYCVKATGATHACSSLYVHCILPILMYVYKMVMFYIKLPACANWQTLLIIRYITWDIPRFCIKNLSLVPWYIYSVDKTMTIWFWFHQNYIFFYFRLWNMCI